MEQMELRFNFKEFQEGDLVKLTDVGIKGLSDYYGINVNRKLGYHWETKVYKIIEIVPRSFPYRIRLSGNRDVGLKKDEIKYAFRGELR